MNGIPPSDADSRLMVFSGNANPPLAQSIASHLRMNLGKAVVGKFSDGEVNVEIMEHVRGRDVFVVQPTCAPTNDHLMELLVMVDALRRSSAARITTVIPYFGYARQDRRPRARTGWRATRSAPPCTSPPTNRSPWPRVRTITCSN